MTVLMLTAITLGTAGWLAGLYFLGVERRQAEKAAMERARRTQDAGRANT
jgi:hypothetical protein